MTIAWTEAAACAGDTRRFYSTSRAAIAECRRTCAACPVITDCFADCLATEEPSERFGFRAGMTADERRRLAPPPSKPAVPVEERCVVDGCGNRRRPQGRLCWKCTKRRHKASVAAVGHRGILRGEQSPVAKLTEAQVREIRRAHAAGATVQTLAARYGMGTEVIRDIVKGRLWRHVV